MARHWREYGKRLIRLGEELFSGVSGFLRLDLERAKRELATSARLAWV